MTAAPRLRRVAALLLYGVLMGPAVGAASLESGTGVDQDRNLPELTQPVNDFAHILDGNSAREIDRVIRALKAASGDVIVVATIPTVDPYADINEYAVKLFENHGRGIGDKGRDNGLLIVLALKERRVRVEVGYDLEQWVTDGFAGETSREFMAPLFRQGQYGPGLLAGTERIAARIAQGRGVTLEGVRVPRQTVRNRGGSGLPLWAVILIFLIIWLIGRTGRGGPRSRYWGGGGWSGWSSGVGPFGGGWSSGGGGGGFGGGFGGFGGGRSGGGGGGAGW